MLGPKAAAMATIRVVHIGARLATYGGFGRGSKVKSHTPTCARRRERRPSPKPPENDLMTPFAHIADYDARMRAIAARFTLHMAQLELWPLAMC